MLETLLKYYEIVRKRRLRYRATHVGLIADGAAALSATAGHELTRALAAPLKGWWT